MVDVCLYIKRNKFFMLEIIRKTIKSINVQLLLHFVDLERF